MGKHAKKWDDHPSNPYADAEAQAKADDFDKSYEENKAAGEVRAEQDPYRRPHATGRP